MKELLRFQRNEITEYHIYRELSRMAGGRNAEILRRIAEEEKAHYLFFRKLTGRDVKPSMVEIIKYKILARIFGLTFAIKLMENGENWAQESYEKLEKIYPEIAKIKEDEEKHEKELINMIEEEKLKYIGSIVLGLNDALVELTGALAGLTFALQNSKLIAVAGLITGIAASISMAASEYLSQRAEGGKDPLKASIYTGIAYITTVLLLVLPFFLVPNPFISILFTIGVAVAEIALFTFFVAVVRDESFRKSFLEMAGISLGVAFLSFLIGIVVRHFLGVEV